MPDQALAALRELTDAVKAEFFGNDTNLSKRLIKATNEAQLVLMVQPQAAELAMLRQLARPVAIPGEAYHDDMGPVTWWRFPVEEAPWVGTPGDSDWPGYHTHFTPCPLVPAPPEDRPND